MSRFKLLVLLVAVSLAGCPDAVQTDLSDIWEGIAGDLLTDAGRTTVDVEDGSIRVKVISEAPVEARIKVTMRVAGAQVHYAERRIPAHGTDIIIGPDRADSVLVEASLTDTAPVVEPLRTYFLGTDFESGDMLVVVVEPEVQGEPDDDDGEVTRPTSEAVEVEVIGLEEEVRVNSGDYAYFSVVVTGDYSGDATVAVFADSDAIPGSGNEITIIAGVAAASAVPVAWQVEGAALTCYRVYAEVLDGADLARSDVAAGQVCVNSPPALVFDSPRPEQAVTLGRLLRITWAGQDLDDNATITLLFDPDDEFNGNEQLLRSDIAEDDAGDREYWLDTGAFGEYYSFHIMGIIDDGLVESVVHAGPICLSYALVGRFTPEDLESGEITTIVGEYSADGGSMPVSNRRFGAALDCSGSIEQGSGADLIVSDPESEMALARGTRGSAYYFQNVQITMADAALAGDAYLKIISEQDGAGTGRGVAFIGDQGGQIEVGELLIGAPWYLAASSLPRGLFYYLDGAELLAWGSGDTVMPLSSVTDPIVERSYAEVGGQCGYSVTSIGDVLGSGAPAYAVGAPGMPAMARAGDDGVGKVYVFCGGVPTDGPISASSPTVFQSSTFGDYTGYSVCSLGLANDDEYADLAIGTPYGPSGEPGSGMVHAVFLTPMHCSGGFGPYTLGVEDPKAPEARLFHGINDGDLTGWSISSGDFDGSGLPDLLIGAPGYDQNRGRVYVLFDVGDDSWPAVPESIDLSLVGDEYYGLVIDGLAIGDQLGYAVAAISDFDWDGYDDILLGAPGAESDRGAAYLIYGGYLGGWRGMIDLAELGTCYMDGCEFVGPEGEISRFGEALSSGDLDGDGFGDAGIGAPGDYSNPGAVHIIYSQPGHYSP